MGFHHRNAKTVSQDVPETQPGKRSRPKRQHIRPTSATIQDNPKAEDPFVLFPENIDTPSQFNTFVTGNTLLENRKPEVSPPEQSPNATTRSGRNVVCPHRLKDFVKY